MKRLMKKDRDLSKTSQKTRLRRMILGLNPEDYQLPDQTRQIELYHFTSLKHFIDMMNEGQITPGGYSGNVSGGGHQTHYSLTGQGKKTGRTVQELIAIQSSLNIVLDPDVLKKIEELKAQFPDEAELNQQIVQVIVSNPSHNQTGVYLTNKTSDREGYGFSATRNYQDKSLPNTSVMLTVYVNADALGPDLDDTSVNDELDVPYYEQTLNSVGQCLHNGPIPLEQLMGVTVDRSDWINVSKFITEYEFANWARQYIDYGIVLSSEVAYQSAQEMYEAFNQLDPNEMKQDKVMTY